MQYRKKPVVVDAEQRTGDVTSLDRILALQTTGRERIRWGDDMKQTLLIPTGSGEARCYIGDWVIRGVQGELYPCRAGVFALTYELEESHAEECQGRDGRVEGGQAALGVEEGASGHVAEAGDSHRAQ